VRTITREGDERILSSITEGAKNSARSYRIRCDGQPHYLPDRGYSMACVYISPNEMHGENFSSGGQVSDYWGESVSPDGQQLTETRYVDKTFTKTNGIMVLDRLTDTKN
jgi:hypothetical protein